MRIGAGLAAKVPGRVLEFFAAAQIPRREVQKGSPAFHNLTASVLGYGTLLALLVGTSTEGQ
jgi:hypothetical protein